MRGMWRIRDWRERLISAAALRRAEAAVARFPSVVHQRPHNLAHPVVVSLTSYPPRFPNLSKTLKSLLDQTVLADETILWLTNGDISVLPPEVRSLEARGLKIRSCDDMRSFKKIIPALLEFPDAAIVTADDDTYYPPDWLETLTTAAATIPSTIVALRCHRVLLNPDGSLGNYADWPKITEVRDETTGDWLFPTGVGGILYPPGALAPEVVDIQTFMEVCPHADDIWLFWMGMLAKAKRYRAGTNPRLVQWDGSQDIALYHSNVLDGQNDRQIKKIEERLGLIRR